MYNIAKSPFRTRHRRQMTRSNQSVHYFSTRSPAIRHLVAKATIGVEDKGRLRWLTNRKTEDTTIDPITHSKRSLLRNDSSEAKHKSQMSEVKLPTVPVLPKLSTGQARSPSPTLPSMGLNALQMGYNRLWRIRSNRRELKTSSPN